jgi:hypothetical protein
MSTVTRAEYLETLKRRAEGAGDPTMQKSLLAWISACTPVGDGSIPGQRMRLSRAIEDMQDRIIPLSSDDARPPFERNGFTVRDTPLLAVDLSGCVILRGSTVICDNKVFAKDFRSATGGWKEIGWYMGAEDIGFVDYDICTNTALVDISAEAGTTTLPDSQEYFFFASNYAGSNFGHFVHDTLAQLLAYERMCEMRGTRLVPILARPLQFPMQKFLFDKLVCPPSEAVYLPRHPISVKKCFSATMPMTDPGTGEVSLDALRYLRGRIHDVKQTLGIHGALSIPKIYISRSDATGTGRRFSNLVEAESLLRKRDFTFVTVSKLGPEQLLSIFDECSTVVGVHGAGLLNVFLTQHDAKTIELADYPNSWESIPSILLAGGFDHFRVRALAPHPESDNLPSVDVEGINRIL